MTVTLHVAGKVTTSVTSRITTPVKPLPETRKAG
jgi:hypothetical protein